MHSYLPKWNKSYRIGALLFTETGYSYFPKMVHCWLPITVLNSLLSTRYKYGTYIPQQSQDSQEVLSKIIGERRKELVMRDIRWQDIKRLNKEGAGINIKRILGGQIYELSANSPRFALPFPAYIIQMTGMKQNPR